MSWNEARKAPKFFKEETHSNEFRAVLDKNTSLVIVEKQNKFEIVIKKELFDHELEVTASEAPVKNYVAGEILPFEYVVAPTEILEKEIINFNQKIREIFGKKYDLKLTSIRLCVGSEENYVTVDESNLKDVDIIPTIQGLKNFINNNNKKSVFGFTIRRYDTKKGNLIFCECELNHPIFDLKSIKIQIMSSLSQRGLYMQKHHAAYGLHVYYVLSISKFTDMIVNLFNEIKIPIEMIYLKRKSSIQNWRARECELNEKNLKNYLQFQYNSLSHTDVEHIVSIIKNNKLSFEIATKMADLLNRMKHDRIEIDEGLLVLEQEDIAAAAKIVVNYFGFNNENLNLPSNLDLNTIKKSIDELDRYIH